MQAFAACERSLALRVHVTFGERHRGGERGGLGWCNAVQCLGHGWKPALLVSSGDEMAMERKQ
jgi:hypothetical protein